MAKTYAADPVSRLLAWRRASRSKVVECLEIFVVSALVAFGIRAYAAEARYIPSRSMLPGLWVGDRLIVEKLSHRLLAPRRGEILVFAAPGTKSQNKAALIKRVVGLPGDEMAIDGNRVWINGKLLNEPYVAVPGKAGADAAPDRPDPPMDWTAIGMPGGVVPAHHVFLMGDNRYNSTDSRIFGPVPTANIIGKPIFRFFPVNRLGVPR